MDAIKIKLPSCYSSMGFLGRIVTFLVVAIVAIISTAGNDVGIAAQEVQVVQTTCLLVTAPGVTVSGVFSLFLQCPQSVLTIKGQIAGVAPDTDHFFTMHEMGDLTNTSHPCGSVGKTFDTYGGDIEYPGVLAKATSNPRGVILMNMNATVTNMCNNNIPIGRSVVVHPGEIANTGVACCALGLASPVNMACYPPHPKPYPPKY